MQVSHVIMNTYSHLKFKNHYKKHKSLTDTILKCSLDIQINKSYAVSPPLPRSPSPPPPAPGPSCCRLVANARVGVLAAPSSFPASSPRPPSALSSPPAAATASQRGLWRRLASPPLRSPLPLSPGVKYVIRILGIQYIWISFLVRVFPRVLCCSVSSKISGIFCSVHISKYQESSFAL